MGKLPNIHRLIREVAWAEGIPVFPTHTAINWNIIVQSYSKVNRMNKNNRVLLNRQLLIQAEDILYSWGDDDDQTNNPTPQRCTTLFRKHLYFRRFVFGFAVALSFS
jgi:hypothetical protein